MTTSRRYFILLVLVSFLFSWPAHTAEPIVIIANISVPVSHLTVNQIKNIFMGKAVFWPDQTLIQLTTLETDTQALFLSIFIKRSPSQFQMYWRRMLFTGKADVPKSFENEAELVRFVSETKGAIGYVRSDTPITGTKKITIIDEDAP